MFMCKECHKKDEEKGICSPSHFDNAFSCSMGKCEICSKTAICVDCLAYKYAKIPSNTSLRIE